MRIPTVSRAVLAFAAAYQSNQNINLYAGCAPLQNPRITLKATLPIASTQESNVANTTWGPQLNIYCAPTTGQANPMTYAQYTPYTLNGTLAIFVETWGPHGMIYEIFQYLTPFGNLPGNLNVLPAGWTIDWTVATDPVTFIPTGTKCFLLNQNGSQVASANLSLSNYVSVSAPLSVMTLDLLSDNGSFAIFSSGAGSFTYSLGGGQTIVQAPSPPTVACVADPSIHTGEQSNMQYGMPVFGAGGVTQSFNVPGVSQTGTALKLTAVQTL